MGSKLKVLYLAHYAPDAAGTFPAHDALHQVYAQYHQEVYQILQAEDISLVSSNDPACMLYLPADVKYIFSLYNRMPFRNSEVFVSAVAEYYKVGYLGGPPNVRALAEDKHLGKMMAEHAGVSTPKWIVYSTASTIQPPNFTGPYFVKPRFGAASKHITEQSLCQDWGQAKQQINILLAQGEDAILEEFVNGIYHTSPVLGNFGLPIALPCIEQKSILPGNIVTYHQKRKVTAGLTRTIVNDAKLNQQLQDCSLKMFTLVQPLDYTRFDYIVAHDGSIQFLEFNVCCNLGRHSTISQAANEMGYKYENVIQNIFHSSLHRWELPADRSHQF